MSRGRKRTPTETLKARGSTRINDRTSEPKVKPKLPPCPPWVSEKARLYWKQYGKDLLDAKVVSNLDAVAFGLLVDALAQYHEARSLVESEGLTERTCNGNTIQHPAVGAMNKAWERVLKACREFGMTPSARAGVHQLPDEQVTDDKARFFG